MVIRKVLASSVALSVLVISVLLVAAGCSRPASDGTSLLSGQKLDHVTLTFLFPGTANARTAAVLEAVQKASRAAVNADIVFTYVPEDEGAYVNRLFASAAAGDPFDAFYVVRGTGDSLPNLVSAGAAADITSLFPRYAPDLAASIPAARLDAVRVEGKLYAIPNLAPTSSRRVATVRDDLLTRVGMTTINSYDDLDIFAEKVHAAAPDIIPLSFFDLTVGMFAEAAGYVTLDYWQGLVYRADDPAMRVIPWERAPAFRDAVTRLRSWSQNGWLMESMGWYFIPIDATLVTSDRVAAFLGTLGQSEQWNFLVASSTSYRWRYKEFPLSPDRVSARTSPLEGALVLRAGAPHPERTLQFINWVHARQENYDLLMYGVKNKDYTLKSGLLALPAGIDPKDAYLQWPGRAGFADLRRERPMTGSAASYRDWYADQVATKTALPAHGTFVPDFSSVPSALTTSRGESGWIFEASVHGGSYNGSSVDAYIKEQQTAGVDKIAAAVQAELDAWRRAHGR